MPAARLTRSTIARFPVPTSEDGRVVQRVVWDQATPGFGVRLSSTGARSFVIKTRAGGKQRWITLGRWPRLGIRTARLQARRVLFEAGSGAINTKEDR